MQVSSNANNLAPYIYLYQNFFGVAHFVTEVPTNASRQLKNLSFPENIRKLIEIVKRAFIFCFFQNCWMCMTFIRRKLASPEG